MDKFTPTKFPELNKVIQKLINRLTILMEADLLGAYQQGSFAVGNYDRHSDVDFIIVTKNEISGSQLQSLQLLHKRIFELESAWAQHLDGSYFPKDALRYPSNPGQELWYLDNGSSKLVKSVHCRHVDRAGA